MGLLQGTLAVYIYISNTGNTPNLGIYPTSCRLTEPPNDCLLSLVYYVVYRCLQHNWHGIDITSGPAVHFSAALRSGARHFPRPRGTFLTLAEVGSRGETGQQEAGGTLNKLLRSWKVHVIACLRLLAAHWGKAFLLVYDQLIPLGPWNWSWNLLPWNAVGCTFRRVRSIEVFENSPSASTNLSDGYPESDW